jgi:hypothetical protein
VHVQSIGGAAHIAARGQVGLGADTQRRVVLAVVVPQRVQARVVQFGVLGATKSMISAVGMRVVGTLIDVHNFHCAVKLH